MPFLLQEVLTSDSGYGFLTPLLVKTKSWQFCYIHPFHPHSCLFFLKILLVLNIQKYGTSGKEKIA